MAVSIGVAHNGVFGLRTSLDGICRTPTILPSGK